MSNLRIALVQKSANQVYYPGNTVTGNLLLDVKEPKNYKYVSIKFTGKSYVHWTESEGTGDNERSVTYTSTEPYIDLGATLWSMEQSPGGKLAPGQYSWPFSFNIPQNAPSSFEGTVGYIRYALVGRINTGLLKFDHVAEVRIPVQQLVCITDPRLLRPQRQEVQKKVCCWCCASQPIVLSVYVPKTGFCIGESFNVHVSLENGSGRQLTMIAAISQRMAYRANDKQRYSGKTLISVGSNEIEPRAIREWDPTIEIPPADVVHESSCHNIKIIYSLIVTAVIPRGLNLATSVQLMLGNCKVQEGGQNPSTQPALQPQQGLPFTTQPGANPPPGQPFQPGAYPPPGQPPMAYPPSGPLGVPPPAGPPGQSGFAFPPNPSTAAPVGWSTQLDTNVPPASFPPPTSEKPLETLADIPVPDNEKKPL